MNIYQFAVSDGYNFEPYVFIKKITAKSLNDCKDCIVRWIFNTWEDIDFHSEEYDDIIDELKNFNIILGNIEEID